MLGVVVETGRVPENPGARKEPRHLAPLETRSNVRRTAVGERANAFEIGAVLIPLVESAHALIRPATSSGVRELAKRSHHLQLLLCMSCRGKAANAEDEVVLGSVGQI